MDGIDHITPMGLLNQKEPIKAGGNTQPAQENMVGGFTFLHVVF